MKIDAEKLDAVLKAFDAAARQIMKRSDHPEMETREIRGMIRDLTQNLAFDALVALVPTEEQSDFNRNLASLEIYAAEMPEGHQGRLRGRRRDDGDEVRFR